MISTINEKMYFLICVFNKDERSSQVFAVFLYPNVQKITVNSDDLLYLF